MIGRLFLTVAVLIPAGIVISVVAAPADPTEVAPTLPIGPPDSAQVMPSTDGTVATLPTGEEQLAPATGERSWPRPRIDDRRRERDLMVAELRRYSRPRVDDPRVLDAMHAVPRHLFIPDEQQPHAYRDSPLPIGQGQTISQPYIVALMTQLAEVDSTMKVLEVGTGSGYQAAVLNELTPHVFTIEIVPTLARRAAATFGRWGYTSIRTREGDGYRGWPEEAPFDRILVTAAPEAIPPALIDQLKPGGRMVLPVGPRGARQDLLVVTKTATGSTTTREVIPVRFVPMVHGKS